MAGSSLSLKPGMRIGIINRGEAAVRFIFGLKRFNLTEKTSLRSVAFYTPKEREALFARMADFSYLLTARGVSNSTATSPYLNPQTMLEALQESECQAVWVGWGFLAEDPSFARLMTENGIVFLGPSHEAMRLLGDKIEAKTLAESAGVPVLPWSRRPIVDLEDAQAEAEKIGFPLIIKAANGGGGRGIRVVQTPDQLAERYLSAVGECERLFGSVRLFIETMVVQGRHLEVQIAADNHGNVCTYGVRDCSVQRKNQKIIEETPPPGVASEVARKLEEAAARLVRAADYRGVGTVEYIYDVQRDSANFMEVNTRLQVEHPITEELYGVDLIHLQLAIAMGHELAVCNSHEVSGHVIEFRLNAEDPDKEFIPSPGEILTFVPPQLPGIRVDSGFRQGDNISSDYDSMIAKIISKGKDRDEAIAKLKGALDELRISIKGGTTNRGFVKEILNDEEFLLGAVTTDYVDSFFPRRRPKPHWDLALAALAIYRHKQVYNEELLNFKLKISRQSIPQDVFRATQSSLKIDHQGYSYDFIVRTHGLGMVQVIVDGYSLDFEYINHRDEIQLKNTNNKYVLQMVDRGDFLQIEINGESYQLEYGAKGMIKSPSPSLIISINVKVGQKIKRGDLLFTLEAMKMEMAVSAPCAGRVKEIKVRKGEQVAAGQEILELELNETLLANKSEAKEARILFGGLVGDAANPAKAAARQWYLLTREYFSVFSGYDFDPNVQLTLERMILYIKKYPEFTNEFTRCVLDGCKMYIAIEDLFSLDSLVGAESQEGDFQEIIRHYFLRKGDQDKGFPAGFLERLARATSLYPMSNPKKRTAATRVILNIYKSHFHRQYKEKLLRLSLFALIDVGVDAQQIGAGTAFADDLDALITIAERNDPLLVDAVIHARHVLIDAPKVEGEMHSQIAQVRSAIKKLVEADAHTRDLEIEALLFSGIRLVDSALSLCGSVGERECYILELIGRKLNCDRELKAFSCQSYFGHLVYTFVSSADDVSRHMIIHDLKAVSTLGWLNDIVKPGSQENSEFYLWLANSPDGKPEFERLLATVNCSVHRVVLGIRMADNRVVFHNYGRNEDRFVEMARLRGMSPLSERQFKLARYEHFDLEPIFCSDLVHLVKATAYENLKDVRLVAFVEVPQVTILLDQQGKIARAASLSNAIFAAAGALRAHQARSEERLLMNRIIVHISEPLSTGRLGEPGPFHATVCTRLQGIGLQKLIIYATYQRHDGTFEKVETGFENFGTQLALKEREPTLRLIKPIDDYGTRVERSLRRGCPYPYDLIKMLTLSATCDFPRGVFEEYDIEVENDGTTRPRSVEGRAFGLNSANIVFGLITNFFAGYEKGLERVIILGDPSRDFASLAEKECRLVIAALDLAERRGVPIEWVAVSSGARIDMESGTENLDWTAAVLRRIIEFTQEGGEIHVIAANISVGAQSYWNAESTMLMHTTGLLIMTDEGSLLLTGKKALDFSGSVSAENNLGIGGVEKIMGLNGQAQFKARDIKQAFTILFRHYALVYSPKKHEYACQTATLDPIARDITLHPYKDAFDQGFSRIGDIFGEKNLERKKPFDMRQLMKATIDSDKEPLVRWKMMRDAETAIIWEARIGGWGVGLIGIESSPVKRHGSIPNDGPESWSGGTLFPMSSKKIARAINAFSRRLPLVILANLSGFDGSPESMRGLQLEFGAEIGRAVVNFKGPLIFVVVSRYHGGAYVVFSKSLNPSLQVAAIEGSFASVIGGAPAAAVVFPRLVQQRVFRDPRVEAVTAKLQRKTPDEREHLELLQMVQDEYKQKIAQEFEGIHTIQRAKRVGSVDDIIKAAELRPYLCAALAAGVQKFRQVAKNNLTKNGDD